ncbi:MAG: hypothetical protein KIT31_15435 [Deltaproteobacteria bacterium]|nr:hypothetical protein [Deltaproteobacteria bacterium]
MTKSGLVLVMLAATLAVTTTAAAGTITPPAGWTQDKELGERNREPHFGGGPVQLQVEAYRPAAPGCVLFVSRAQVSVPTKQRDAAASLEVEELEAKLRREGPDARSETAARKADAATKSLDATLRWRDANLVTSSRVVVVGDATTLIAVRGECLASTDASAAAALTACEAALATLDPGMPVDQRVALSLVADPAAALEATITNRSGSAAPPEGSAAPRADELPRLSDGSRYPAAPPVQVVQTQSDPDRRPLYVGAVLILFAGAFWWNRKRRERFDREDRGDAADDDADDLHAAAEEDEDEGEEPEETKAKVEVKQEKKAKGEATKAKGEAKQQKKANVEATKAKGEAKQQKKANVAKKGKGEANVAKKGKGEVKKVEGEGEGDGEGDGEGEGEGDGERESEGMDDRDGAEVKKANK